MSPLGVLAYVFVDGYILYHYHPYTDSDEVLVSGGLSLNMYQEARMYLLKTLYPDLIEQERETAFLLQYMGQDWKTIYEGSVECI